MPDRQPPGVPQEKHIALQSGMQIGRRCRSIPNRSRCQAKGLYNMDTGCALRTSLPPWQKPAAHGPGHLHMKCCVRSTSQSLRDSSSLQGSGFWWRAFPLCAKHAWSRATGCGTLLTMTRLGDDARATIKMRVDRALRRGFYQEGALYLCERSSNWVGFEYSHKSIDAVNQDARSQRKAPC